MALSESNQGKCMKQNMNLSVEAITASISLGGENTYSSKIGKHFFIKYMKK